MPTALFRCRASRTIGGGHVVRCLALADELAALGWVCRFAVNPEAVDTVGALKRSGHTLSASEDGAHIDLMIVDDYDLGAHAERALRQGAGQVLIVDDLANRPHECDWLLDPTPSRSRDAYSGLIPTSAGTLLGPAYALLRRPFRSFPAPRDGTVRRVLVMPGQIDAADLAGAAVRALTDTLPAIAVDVVLGAASPHVQAFRGRRNVTLHVDIDAGEVALLMRDADLAIGAGGGGSWERCALGLPSVIAVVSDNQRAVAAELERSQVAIVAAQNPDAIAAAIGRLTPARLADMSRRARALCDGRGTFRTAVALVPAERTISRKELRLRPAEQADAALLLDWQSHPDTRRFARNPDVPSESHHEAWLQAKLADPDSLFTLVVENSTPVASLRLDRVDQDYEISIVVAPGRRHSGIGRGALALARRLVPKRRLVGFVADANTASQRLFSSSGYLRQADGYFVHDG